MPPILKPFRDTSRMMHGNRSRSSPRSTIRLLRLLICARFKHRRSGTVEWDTLSLPYSVAAPDRGAIILLHLNDEQNNPCMNAFLSLLLRGISSGNDKVRQPDISNKADPANRFSSFFERTSPFTRKSGLTCSVEFCFHDHGSFRNLSVSFRPTQTSLRCVFRPGLLIQTPLSGSWMPIHVHGVLLHTISGFELSQVDETLQNGRSPETPLRALLPNPMTFA